MRRRCNAALAFVVVLAVTAVAPGPAGAADSKYYSITLTPQTLTSGERSTISATIRNVSVSSIGSVNLTAPAGFTLVSATVPRGTAAVANNTAQLRSLSIPRGGRSRRRSSSIRRACP